MSEMRSRRETLALDAAQPVTLPFAVTGCAPVAQLLLDSGAAAIQNPGKRIAFVYTLTQERRGRVTELLSLFAEGAILEARKGLRRMARKTDNVIVRMEPELKRQAEQILRSLNVSPSEVINSLYTQIVLARGVPFELILPDEKREPSAPREIQRNTVWNEDCMETLARMPKIVDVILTSPPYNTNTAAHGHRRGGAVSARKVYPNLRYDQYLDWRTTEEYCRWTVDLFRGFDSVLAENGVVLYNLSYGTENTEGMIRAVEAVLSNTAFTLADIIAWRKARAIPNNMSPNRLTRLVENIFVFCRKSEKKTFYCSKQVTSVRRDGQKVYENLYNYIEAANSRQPCPFNIAAYPPELCRKLLKLYAPPHGLVYDPFLGSGTTAVACVELGLDFLGSEISPQQCQWALDRIEKAREELRASQQ